MAVRRTRAFLLACVAGAAVLAAAPVLAQKQPVPGAAAIDPAADQKAPRDPATKDPDTGSAADDAKDRNSIECFDGKPTPGATLDPNCGKDDIVDPRFPGRVVVTLPDILVDLFVGSFTIPAAEQARQPADRTPRRLGRYCPGTASGRRRTGAAAMHRQVQALPAWRSFRRVQSPAPSFPTRCWSRSMAMPPPRRTSPTASASTSARSASPTCLARSSCVTAFRTADG